MAALATATVAVVPGPVDADLSAETGPQPHAPIWIRGDEGFEDPAAISGVRGGNGTPDDPYVISNWTIATHADHAIRIEDTDAHVVIASTVLRGRTCSGDYPTYMCIEKAIALHDADNVTVRNTLVVNAGRALDVQASEHIRVERVAFGSDASNPVAVMGQGIAAGGSEDLVVRNASIEAVYPASVGTSAGVTFEDTTLVGEVDEDEPLVALLTPRVSLPGTREVTFERVEIRDAEVRLGKETGNLSVAHSRFLRGGEVGVTDGSDGTFESATICGSTFRNVEARGLALSDGESGTLRGNAFVGNEDGAQLGLFDEVTVERNLFRNNSNTGFGWSGGAAEAHNNSFENNGHRDYVDGEVFLPQDASEIADARWNWWEDEDGPNVTRHPDGTILHESSGDQLTVDDADEVDWSEWLAEPPAAGPEAVDCGVPDGEPGADRKPSVTVAAHAEASAEAPSGPVQAGADAFLHVEASP